LATARYPCWATDALQVSQCAQEMEHWVYQTLRNVILKQQSELSLRRKLLVRLLHASCGWMSNANTHRE
jgi:hypothetical protein